MFAENAETTEGLQRLMQKVGDRRRGETVTYDEVYAITRIHRKSPNWAAFVRRLRNEFKAKGVTLVAVKNMGYRLETVTEQLIDRRERRLGRASRQLHRDRVETEVLPDEQLSEHQRKMKYGHIDSSKRARRSVQQSLRIGRMLATPTGSGYPRVRPPGSKTTKEAEG